MEGLLSIGEEWAWKHQKPETASSVLELTWQMFNGCVSMTFQELCECNQQVSGEKREQEEEVHVYANLCSVGRCFQQSELLQW